MLFQTKASCRTPTTSLSYLTSLFPLIRLQSIPSLGFASSWPVLSRSSNTTLSLRQLTRKGHPFLWLSEHQVEFDKLKTILTSGLVVWHFDSSQPVFLLTDASRLFGLSYALGHIELNGSGKKLFKIVHCGSKGITSIQQCYSTIELGLFKNVPFTSVVYPSSVFTLTNGPWKGYSKKIYFDYMGRRLNGKPGKKYGERNKQFRRSM